MFNAVLETHQWMKYGICLKLVYLDLKGVNFNKKLKLNKKFILFSGKKYIYNEILTS